MTSNVWHDIGLVAVTVLCTQFTRILPFMIFNAQQTLPRAVTYLGRTLPASIIATLVIYCLKDVRFESFAQGPAALISAALVAALHWYKKNTLLSITVGTVCYMVLIRL